MYIIKYIYANDKILLLLFFFYTIMAGIISFFDLYLPKLIIDQFLEKHVFRKIIYILSIVFMVSIVCNYFLPYLKKVCEPRLTRVRQGFLELFNKKSMAMDYQDIENPVTLNRMKSILTAVQNNESGLEWALNQLFDICSLFLTIVLYSYTMAKLNISFFLCIIINAIFLYLINISAIRYEDNNKEELAQLSRESGYLLNLMYDFAYGKEIRLNNLSKFILYKYRKVFDNQENIEKRIQRKYLRASLMNFLAALFCELIVYSSMVYMVFQNKLSISEFSFCILSISFFQELLYNLMEIIIKVCSQMIYINDFIAFIGNEQRKGTIYRHKESLLSCDIPASIEFKNVYFKYPYSERYILENISFKIYPKQQVAIVGINGAGKTTIVKLLCGLYEPFSGEILINGRPLNSYNYKNYLRNVSVLFQDFKIFAWSIAENVALTIPEKINEEKVYDVLKKTHLLERVVNDNKNIYTAVYKILKSDGIELSSGELQRLAFARILYRKGSIVILDEPTANLDPISEYNLYSNFNVFNNDKTGIYITHKISSCKVCDKILFLKDGKLLEEGSHVELLKKKGEYYKLFNEQIKCYV